jgi:hypothetical protein
VSVKENRARKRRHQFTAAEFFAGIGLVRLALERQGWRVVFANDIDPQKQEMYEANFGGEHFVLGDIHTLDPDDIPTCDLFAASFPCNDFRSLAHAKDSTAKSRRLSGASPRFSAGSVIAGRRWCCSKMSWDSFRSRRAGEPNNLKRCFDSTTNAG